MSFSVPCHDSVKCTSNLPTDFDLRNLFVQTHSTLQSAYLSVCHRNTDEAESPLDLPTEEPKDFFESPSFDHQILPWSNKTFYTDRTMNMSSVLGEASVCGWDRAQVIGCGELIFAAK